MKEDKKKNNVLAVCINNTYKENIKNNATLSKEEKDKKLKEITAKSWRVRENKLADIEYIIGISDKKIESVYKVEGSKKAKDLKRIDFKVNKVDETIEEKIREKYKDTEIKFYGPIKYLDF